MSAENELDKKEDSELLVIAEQSGVEKPEKVLQKKGRNKLISRIVQAAKDFVDSDEDESEDDSAENDKNDPEEDKDARFFKSKIPGLSIPIKDKPGRDEILAKVKFQRYVGYNEKIGEEYAIGLLATPDEDVISILEDDYNVEEIDKKEFEELKETLYKNSRKNPKKS